jgi:lipopolysaccharide biosynthesis glycosyltransferase
MPVYGEWAPMIVKLLRSGKFTQPSPALLHFCAHADPWAAEWMAAYYALAGDRAAALQWMGTAVDRGFTNDRWWSELHPIMSRYRDDAEFQALVERTRDTGQTEPV